MKDSLPGYYHNPKDFKINDDCIFVFDTNVLLALYEIPEEDSSELINILENENINSRLWLPYHVAWEYQKNRINVINIQENKLNFHNNLKTIQNTIQNICDNIEELTVLQKQYIDVEKVSQKLKPFLPIIKSIKCKKPDFFWNDPIRGRLDEIFSGKIGKKFSDEELIQIEKESKIRFMNQIPPGFKDDKKDGNSLGDLIIWKEILKYANSTKKPFIFITNDRKRDWFYKRNKKTYAGPQADLINEFYHETNQSCHVYHLSEFLEKIGEYLEITVKQETIEHIRNLSTESMESLLNIAYRPLITEAMLESFKNAYNPPLTIQTMLESFKNAYDPSLTTEAFLRAMQPENQTLMAWESFKNVFASPDYQSMFQESLKRASQTSEESDNSEENSDKSKEPESNCEEDSD